MSLNNYLHYFLVVFLKSKIVRVLNLWQKNGVFKIEVIQPLLDMAAASSSGAAPYLGTDEPGKFLYLHTKRNNLARIDLPGQIKTV